MAHTPQDEKREIVPPTLRKIRIDGMKEEGQSMPRDARPFETGASETALRLSETLPRHTEKRKMPERGGEQPSSGQKELLSAAKEKLRTLRLPTSGEEERASVPPHEEEAEAASFSLSSIFRKFGADRLRGAVARMREAEPAAEGEPGFASSDRGGAPASAAKVPFNSEGSSPEEREGERPNVQLKGGPQAQVKPGTQDRDKPRQADIDSPHTSREEKAVPPEKARRSFPAHSSAPEALSAAADRKQAKNPGSAGERTRSDAEQQTEHPQPAEAPKSPFSSRRTDPLSGAEQSHRFGHPQIAKNSLLRRTRRDNARQESDNPAETRRTEDYMYRLRDRKNLISFPILLFLLLALVLTARGYARRQFGDYLQKRYPKQEFTLFGLRPTLFPFGFSARGRSAQDGTNFDLAFSLLYDSDATNSTSGEAAPNENGHASDRRFGAWRWMFRDNYASERLREAAGEKMKKVIDSDYYKDFVDRYDLENQENSLQSLERTVPLNLDLQAPLRLKICYNGNIRNLQDFRHISLDLWRRMDAEFGERVTSVVFESVPMEEDDAKFKELGYARETWVQTVTTATSAPSGSSASAGRNIQKTSKKPEPTIVASGYVHSRFKYSLVLNRSAVSIDEASVNNGVRMVELSGS